MEGTSGIEKFMQQLLNEYKTLRGVSLKTRDCQDFWDVVVITTGDPKQKEAFDLQIQDKLERGELPLDLPIHVVSDPPGAKIGNGGSTLTSLAFLEEKYGEAVFDMKILLMHAGGWSQRIPSASVLGKVFSALPCGSPLYQMLDLNLALYWPIARRMTSGVMLTCGDVIIVYDLGHDLDWKIPKDGFTALAHPSPITIARTHGVYVLKDADKLDRTKKVLVADCLQVLQKPCDDHMRKYGAILPDTSVNKFAEGVTVQGPMAYTDSCFSFGPDIMRCLLDLRKQLDPLKFEIDAYGDFLQCLGPRATSDYIHNTSNISLMVPGLLKARQSVYDALHGSKLNILVLNASKFIHIGTTGEYIHHLCQDDEFRKELQLTRDAFNSWLDDDNSENGPATKRQKLSHKSEACVMHSELPRSCTVAPNSVVEYCQFDRAVSIGSNCIVSNCQSQGSGQSGTDTLEVPDGTFVHTVPISSDGKTQYVTVTFGTSDNLKKAAASEEEVRSLPYLGMTLESACSKLTLDTKSVGPSGTSSVTLWNAKLFPALDTMTASFDSAVATIQFLKLGKGKCPDPAQSRFSMADLLGLKDISAMLKFRRHLFNEIQKKLSQ